jgi:hypothetical protein
MDSHRLAAAGIAVELDLTVGHIAALLIEDGGRTLSPLHRAPWIGEPADAFPAGLPAGTVRLSGDFLCAPFSASDVEPAPLHGWPANSRWDLVSDDAIDGGRTARFRLARPVMGATVEKLLTLRDGHPFLYQEHRFVGGSGAISVAHHPMTVMREGGRLAFSPKRLAMTQAQPLEPDPARSELAYPARTSDVTAFPGRKGTYDLTRYPATGAHEDFLTLVEAEHAGPGWTAVSRHAEADVVLVLKNPRDLPITMLWISNGGRDYAPWNGRHRGVLGIEDGCTAVGHAASIGDNPLKQEGVATAFDLAPDRTVAFRHVIGALTGFAGQDHAEAIEATGDRLEVVSWSGQRRTLSFDGGFLG